MDESSYVERNDLEGPVATTTVLDCRLAFYRQRGSGDIWIVTSGPRATIVHQLLDGRILEEVRKRMAAEDRPRARLGREWTTVRVDDLLVGVRRRGLSADIAFALRDGQRFGGASYPLPTARQPGLWQRIRARVTGRRAGGAITFARHK